MAIHSDSDEEESDDIRGESIKSRKKSKTKSKKDKSSKHQKSKSSSKRSKGMRRDDSLDMGSELSDEKSRSKIKPSRKEKADPKRPTRGRKQETDDAAQGSPGTAKRGARGAGAGAQQEIEKVWEAIKAI